MEDKRKIDEMIARLFEYKKEMSALQEQKSAIQQQYDELEYTLVQTMDEAGISRGGCDAGTVSVKVARYPKIEDMSAFVDWCAANGKSEMLQKRVGKAAFDEYFEANNEYPEGLSSYDKTVVSLRRR